MSVIQTTLLISIPIVVGTGLSLKKAKKAYSTLIVTIHKFAALAIVASLCIGAYNALINNTAPSIELILKIVPILILVIAFGFGVTATIVSIKKRRTISRYHSTFSYLSLFVSIPSILYIFEIL